MRINECHKKSFKKEDFYGVQICAIWRRERDSNPCEIALKRFSRPPRYDHFDIPPYKRNYEIVLEKTLEEKTLLSEKCVCFPQIRGFFADCFRYGKEVSRSLAEMIVLYYTDRI